MTDGTRVPPTTPLKARGAGWYDAIKAFTHDR